MKKVRRFFYFNKILVINQFVLANETIRGKIIDDENLSHCLHQMI